MSVTLRRLMNAHPPAGLALRGIRLGGLLLLAALGACVAPERKPTTEGNSLYYGYCVWTCETRRLEMGFVIEYEAGKECWCGKPVPEHAYARPPALERPSWYGRRARARA